MAKLVDRLRNLFGGRAGKATEADVPGDDVVAGRRDTGGVPDPSARDQASTTGTTPSGEYVGRVAGDDAGYEEKTGAELRAERSRPGDDPTR